MPQDLVESTLGAGIETTAAMAAAPKRRGARRRETPPGACPNCHSALQGAFCHVCGQDTHSLRRPLWSLFAEGFEGLFGFDGRIWRTLIPLMLRPGYVTRRYLKGIRQPYITPVRLFLAASLVLFVTILLASNGGKGMVQASRDALISQGQDPDKAGQAKAAIKDARKALQNPPHAQNGNAILDKAGKTIAQPHDPEVTQVDKAVFGQILVCAMRKWLLPEDLGDVCQRKLDGARRQIRQEQAISAGKTLTDEDNQAGIDANLTLSKPPPVPLEARRRFVDNLQKAVSSPGDYQQALNRWAPRLAFLLAPAYGLLLAAVFFWRRDLYLYDHMVTALHFQSFVFLFIALMIPAGLIFGPQTAGPVFLVWSNIYLYLMLRRVYHSSRLGAVLRIMVLDASYLVLLGMAFMVLLVLGVVFV